MELDFLEEKAKEGRLEDQVVYIYIYALSEITRLKRVYQGITSDK
jgi:hypothetical protein